MTFSATPLGEALVSGYRAMGLANLWTPDLRGKIEAGISAVAAGQRTKVQDSKPGVLEPTAAGSNPQLKYILQQPVDACLV